MQARDAALTLQDKYTPKSFGVLLGLFHGPFEQFRIAVALRGEYLKRKCLEFVSKQIWSLLPS
jgi:hypothetical protein